MNVILLALVTLGCTIQSISKKEYNIRWKGGIYSFSAASTFVALLFFMITSGGKFSFTVDALWFSIGFAAANSLSIVGSMLAIKTGPLSLSSLITSYSLIVPTLYGLIMLNESVELWLIIGIVLLFASLFFINIEKKNEEKKISLKWGIFVLMSFVGNGLCSTLQKVQQMQFGGLYKNEFMIVALLINILVLLLFACATEKRNICVN